MKPTLHLYIMCSLLAPVAATNAPCKGLFCRAGMLNWTECAEPPSLHGRIPILRRQTYIVGSRALYECSSPCKVSTGSPVARCKPDGTWTRPTLHCKASSLSGGSLPTRGCGPPPAAKHTEVITSNTGTVVTYTCNNGYQYLRGSKVYTCCAPGIWRLHKKSLRCRASRCKHPESLRNGRQMKKRRSHIGDSVRYTCDMGYSLIGTNRTICMMGGGWSSRPPLCQAIDCGTPTIPNGNITLLTGATVFQSSMKVRCLNKPGVEHSASCTSKGRWYPQVTCPDLSTSTSTMLGMQAQLAAGTGSHVDANLTSILLIILMLALHPSLVT